MHRMSSMYSHEPKWLIGLNNENRQTQMTIGNYSYNPLRNVSPGRIRQTTTPTRRRYCVESLGTTGAELN